MNKYKLINKQTGEEHICDKVVVDGWDYYVSDEDLGINKPFWGYCWNWRNKINYFENGLSEYARGRNYLGAVGGIQKIIATNNPNIDIPKVVDEVEMLGEDETNIRILQHKTPSQIARQYFDGFIQGYNKSQETHPFSEEDVKEIFKIAQMQKNYGDYKPYTFEETIQLWIEQRPKTLYYE